MLVITHCEVGKSVERTFNKNPLKPNTASHNSASWYADTDGFLEHSPREGSLYKGPDLQKIILGFGRPLRYYNHTPRDQGKYALVKEKMGNLSREIKD